LQRLCATFLSLFVLVFSLKVNAQMDMHDAFMAALHSSEGGYKGELRGDFAAFVREKLNTSSSVFVDVQVVRVFKQVGCKRLQAKITVPDVKWQDKKTGNDILFSYEYAMNLCSDGGPPLDVALELHPKQEMPAQVMDEK
jgi:hypothetical protein